MSNQGYFDAYDSLMQRCEKDKKDQVARMNRSVPLVHVEGLPLNYTMWGFAYEPLEYTNWMDESMSWKETCYIGDWSQMPKYFLKGPDAEMFLSRLCINSFENFKVGQAKHGVMCRENGNVAWEGIIWKYGEGDFYLTSARDPWIVKNLESGGYDATWQTVSNDYFIWMVQGPTSLFALEKACGESLRDIKFSHFRKAKINGKEVVIGRTGMGGGLGYEIHGPMEIVLDIHKLLISHL